MNPGQRGVVQYAADMEDAGGGLARSGGSEHEFGRHGPRRRAYVIALYYILLNALVKVNKKQGWSSIPAALILFYFPSASRLTFAEHSAQAFGHISHAATLERGVNLPGDGGRQFGFEIINRRLRGRHGLIVR